MYRLRTVGGLVGASGCRYAQPLPWPPSPLSLAPAETKPSADGLCVYMNSARPRVISESSPDAFRNGRARIRSNQYDVPPAATSASKIACSRLFDGSKAAGSVGIGVADPENGGVPGSTPGGSPGT